MGEVFSRLEILKASYTRTPALQNSLFVRTLNAFFDEVKTNPTLAYAYNTSLSRYHAESTWWRYGYQLWSSLGAYDALCASRRHLYGALQALAQLDAYLSVVRLLRELQNHHLPVTLAAFRTGDGPSFVFEDLRHPLLSYDSVANNFDFGGNRGFHAVITGPHACGKTTVMRAIGLAHVLGQSILLTFANKAEFVPLTGIETYMNVGDSIQEGRSSFQAEHDRMAVLEKKLGALKKNDRILFLIDEPYAKTIQPVGAPRVANFLRRAALREPPRAMIWTSTHYAEPATLEQETNGKIKNFQPLLNDSLMPTYKVVEGAADWWFNDAVKREQFIDYIIAPTHP